MGAQECSDPPSGGEAPAPSPTKRLSMPACPPALLPARPVSPPASSCALPYPGERNLPQNLTCNPGSSLLLCLDLPEGGDSSSAHVLLWSASKRKGLVIWTPERKQYVVKPSHSGRITYLGYSSFQLNNLRQSDEGVYEVLVRTPGSPNPLLLHERTSYSFGINITTDLLVNNSCTLGLHCEAPPPSFRIPGDFLVGYTTAKVLLTPPPLFFLYLYFLKRKESRQKSYPVESFSMAPTVSPPRDPTETSPMDPDF
nr:uncharacterized protein LOC110081426 isoform X1 [Pogona vitticeps]XP_020653764.1 uncharacterized protein LOC110081426 isoform X1 [Pogona vitticeps]